MLLGTYTPKLDDKGRVILPAKFREDLAGGIVVTRGQERCLYVFSTAEFQLCTKPVPRISSATMANSPVFLTVSLIPISPRKARWV